MEEELSYGFIDDAKEFLKKIGLWDKIVDMLKDAGVKLCAKIIPENICQAIADSI